MIFMIKGLRKNVFVLKCGRDSPFESAFFILKAAYSSDGYSEDIVAEAERLVAEVFADRPVQQTTKKGKNKKLK